MGWRKDGPCSLTVHWMVGDLVGEMLMYVGLAIRDLVCLGAMCWLRPRGEREIDG